MYPLVRLAKEYFMARKSGPLHAMDTHVSHHRCWPQDLDLFMEMNNGRILTILDLGRTSLAHRAGLLATLRKQRWGLTMAGVSVRYRKRISPFVMISSCILINPSGLATNVLCKLCIGQPLRIRTGWSARFACSRPWGLMNRNPNCRTGYRAGSTLMQRGHGRLLITG